MCLNHIHTLLALFAPFPENILFSLLVALAHLNGSKHMVPWNMLTLAWVVEAEVQVHPFNDDRMRATHSFYVYKPTHTPLTSRPTNMPLVLLFKPPPTPGIILFAPSSPSGAEFITSNKPWPCLHLGVTRVRDIHFHTMGALTAHHSFAISPWHAFSVVSVPHCTKLSEMILSSASNC